MRNNTLYLVDPNDTVEYTYGMLKELANLVDVTYVTKKGSIVNLDRIKTKKLFYSASSKSRIYMGLNYLLVYLRLIILSFLGKVDIIHIQWCKLEKIDPILIKLLRLNSKVILTAHNVLPHVNGEQKLVDYGRIYDSVDTIIVHGGATKQEMISTFKNLEHKIYVQPYGFCMLDNPDKKVEDNLIKDVINAKEKYGKIVMCLGLINKYKGTDRIINIWNKYYSNQPYLLVIAGKIIEEFDELSDCVAQKAENVWIRNRHLTEYEFKKLSELADIIVLPYRNASMSGVVYAAARASTTVLTTRSGTIPEYLENGCDSIVVDNNDEALKNGLEIFLSYDKKRIEQFGKCLHDNFERKYEWAPIVQKLVEECYQL